VKVTCSFSPAAARWASAFAPSPGQRLRSAVRSAGLTIDANLASLKDAGYTGVVKEERQRLDAESAADADHGLSLVSGKPG